MGSIHNEKNDITCNNADIKVQCIKCGERFVNIDGCPNGCRAGLTFVIE